jgi:hypothetical protein
MVETWQRLIGHTLRVGDKDVQITIHETYMGDNPGVPAYVRVVAPNGLITEGGVAEAWREMHVLLGITPPSPPKAPESPEPQKSDSSPKSSTQLPSIQQPAAAPLPALAAARLSAPALSAPATDERESPQYELEEEDIEAEEDRPMNRNTLKETLIRVLNSPVQVADDSDGDYEDEPPREITAEDVAGIPNLATSADAAAFIEDVDRNIELIEMRADAVARAKKLEYLKKANSRKRCEHVKLNGENCGSPAVRRERFCHFHGQAHASSIDLPVIEDQRSLQIALTKLAQQVASNKIDAVQAKLLLQILESAGRNLPAEGLES